MTVCTAAFAWVRMEGTPRTLTTHVVNGHRQIGVWVVSSLNGKRMWVPQNHIKSMDDAGKVLIAL